MLNTAMGLSGIIFFLCVFLLYRNFSQRHEYDTTMAMVRDGVQRQSLSINENTVRLHSETLTVDDERDTPDYSELYDINPDLAGWLKIPNTPVDYPVMQTPDDPEFYLYRDFFKNDSKYGLPFITVDCDLTTPWDNILIYGHHMKDGGAFGVLSQYTDAEFYAEHPIIYFDTLESCYEYEIIYVFKTSAMNGIPFYNFIHMNNVEDYEEFTSSASKAAFYQTDVTLRSGTRLMTLVTCEYTLQDGRLIIVAQQKNFE